MDNQAHNISNWPCTLQVVHAAHVLYCRYWVEIQKRSKVAMLLTNAGIATVHCTMTALRCVVGWYSIHEEYQYSKSWIILRNISNRREALWLFYSLELGQTQPSLIFTHPIRTTGISKIPALMKKVIPAANFPLSSFIVQVYSGLKINWLQKLHKLSADARMAKRAPKRTTKVQVKQCQKNIVHTNNKIM